MWHYYTKYERNTCRDPLSQPKGEFFEALLEFWNKESRTVTLVPSLLPLMLTFLPFFLICYVHTTENYTNNRIREYHRLMFWLHTLWLWPSYVQVFTQTHYYLFQLATAREGLVVFSALLGNCITIRGNIQWTSEKMELEFLYEPAKVSSSQVILLRQYRTIYPICSNIWVLGVWIEDWAATVLFYMNLMYVFCSSIFQ